MLFLAKISNDINFMDKNYIVNVKASEKAFCNYTFFSLANDNNIECAIYKTATAPHFEYCAAFCYYATGINKTTLKPQNIHKYPVFIYQMLFVLQGI